MSLKLFVTIMEDDLGHVLGSLLGCDGYKPPLSKFCNSLHWVHLLCFCNWNVCICKSSASAKTAPASEISLGLKFAVEAGVNFNRDWNQPHFNRFNRDGMHFLTCNITWSRSKSLNTLMQLWSRTFIRSPTTIPDICQITTIWCCTAWQKGSFFWSTLNEFDCQTQAAAKTEYTIWNLLPDV